MDAEGQVAERAVEAEDLQEVCSVGLHDQEESWVVLAWRAWLHGQRNWAALGRQFNKDYRTVASKVRKYSRLVSSAYAEGDVDALAEYVEGLREDLLDADKMAENAELEFAKLGGIGRRIECRKLIAAARGVVTERNATTLKGDPTAPIPVDLRLAMPVEDAASVIGRHVNGGSRSPNGHGPAAGDPDGSEPVAD